MEAPTSFHLREEESERETVYVSTELRGSLHFAIALTQTGGHAQWRQQQTAWKSLVPQQEDRESFKEPVGNICGKSQSNKNLQDLMFCIL